jgi:hypothetical protein
LTVDRPIVLACDETLGIDAAAKIFGFPRGKHRLPSDDARHLASGAYQRDLGPIRHRGLASATMKPSFMARAMATWAAKKADASGFDQPCEPAQSMGAPTTAGRRGHRL